MLERIDVHLVFRLLHRRRHRLRAELQPVGAAGKQFLLGHPHHRRLELIGGLRRMSAAEITSPRLQSTSSVKRERDGLPAMARGTSPPKVTMRATREVLPEGSTRTASPGRTWPLQIMPMKPRKSWFGRFTHCTGMRNARRWAAAASTSTVSRCSRSVGPAYQGVSLGLLDDVVALQPGDRNRQKSLDADTVRERAVIGNDRLVGLAVVADQIHLVDREHEIRNADEVREIAVASRLREHAFARIDENDGEIRGRCAGDHVARVLLVTRGVGHDEFAPVGGKESIGHIDGDPLLPLGGEAVDEQREVDVAGLACRCACCPPAAPRADPRTSSCCRTGAARSASICRRPRSRR